MSRDAAQLLAVADARLRVALAGSNLAHLIGSAEPPIGRSLLELFANPEVASDLRLLRCGVAREVRLATLETDQCVVASLVASDVGDPPVVIVQLRPLPSEPAADEEIFVGRREELETFEQFLAGMDGSMLVLEGPIGIGKSALLRAFERMRAIYVERRGKHELIAAEMGLPYGTFRRYHARALDRVRELLIERASSDEAVDAIRENRDMPGDGSG